jgi:hypothetical protein
MSIMFNLSGQAQKTAIGVRGGISIPNLTASGSDQNPLNTGYSSRLGPEFSLFVEFKISELFSVEPMIEYSPQGGKKNGLQAFPLPQGFSDMFPPDQAPTYLYANFNLNTTNFGVEGNVGLNYAFG